LGDGGVVGRAVADEHAGPALRAKGAGPCGVVPERVMPDLGAQAGIRVLEVHSVAVLRDDVVDDDQPAGSLEGVNSIVRRIRGDAVAPNIATPRTKALISAVLRWNMTSLPGCRAAGLRRRLVDLDLHSAGNPAGSTHVRYPCRAAFMPLRSRRASSARPRADRA